MATLTRADLAQIERFLRGLYRQRTVGTLAWYVLKELPRLVDASQTTWNVVAPALGQADVMAWPAQTDHEEYQSALARHVHEHPLIVHFLRTGDPTAIRLSDFLSTTRFHNTALYDELYSGLGYEDQFAMNLQPLGPRWDTIVVARDKRTFTERDREVLNLLRPHLAQAHRQAQVMDRLARVAEAGRHRPAICRIVLGASGAIVRYPLRAQRWLRQYFDLPNVPEQLPDAVQRWLAAARAARTGVTSSRLPPPLVVCRCGRQLIVRLVADDESGRDELLLEERTDPQAEDDLVDVYLTPRERQVLLEVEKGKHNHEIAATLGIRPATVRKHLERVFDKLGVHNRTAAVARMNQGRSEVR